MDRRQFLRSIGTGVAGGVVASATGADVGLWADMMAWLKGPRKTYFIGAPGYAFSYANVMFGLDQPSIMYTSPLLIELWSKASFDMDRWVHPDGGKMLVTRG